jgi:hypothetical protein
MSATETAAFVLTVQEAQAVAALDRTRKSAESLGGGMEKAAAGTKSFEDRAKGVQQKMGPVAAAVGGLSGSMTLMGGAAGKAAAGAGALAGAIGSGSPLVIALSLVATSVAGVITLYQNAKKAQQEFLALASGPGPRFAAEAAAAQAELEKKRLATNGVAGSELELLSGIIDVDAAESNVKARETMLAQMRSREQQLRTRLRTLELGKGSAATGDAGAMQQESERLAVDIKGMEEQIKNRKIEVEQIKIIARAKIEMAKIDEAEKARVEAIAKAKANAAKAEAEALRDAAELARDNELGAKQVRDAEDQAVRQDQALLDQLARDRQLVSSARVVADDKWAITTDLYEKERRAAEEQAQRLNDIQRAQQDTYVNAAYGAFSSVTMAGQQLAIDLVTQQEHAAERAAISLLGSVGNQLVGLGTKAVFEGAMISANPLTPGLGLPLMGIGGAAIVAGIGMGAGGAAWASSLGGASAGGSGSPSSGAARSRGVSAGGGGGGGGGGNVTVNVSYGVSGPAAEDTARAVVGALHVGAARGMIGREVMR